MKRSLPIILCALALLLGKATAQTENDKKLLAAGPLIADPLPHFAQWAVDYTYTDAGKGPHGSKNSRPIHVVFTKTDDIRHRETTLADGGKSNWWRVGRVEVERRGNGENLSGNIGDAVVSDFPELQWISAKYFVGVTTNSNHKYLTFKWSDASPTNGITGPVLAVIDADTRYPVLFRSAMETRQYTILSAPTAPLTVPPDFAAAGKATMQRIESAIPHLSAP